MTLSYARGDLLLGSRQTAGIGLSATGRLGVEPLAIALLDRFPTFVSDYQRRCRAATLPPGTVWLWRETRPWLMGLIVRETTQGPARLRYVEAALLYLANHWQAEGLTSLVLMRPGETDDWPAVRDLIEQYLGALALPVTICETYAAGVPLEP